MSNVVKFPEPKRATTSQDHRIPKTIDHDDRIQRIRSSLEKINKLMAELKNLNTTSEGK